MSESFKSLIRSVIVYNGLDKTTEGYGFGCNGVAIRDISDEIKSWITKQISDASFFSRTNYDFFEPKSLFQDYIACMKFEYYLIFVVIKRYDQFNIQSIRTIVKFELLKMVKNVAITDNNLKKLNPGALISPCENCETKKICTPKFINLHIPSIEKNKLI